MSSKERKEDEVHLRKIRTLGKGTFGKVYKMQSLSGEVALKVANSDPHLDRNEAERNILLRLSNINIVKLRYFYFVSKKRSINLVLELMDDGDLLHFVSNKYDKKTVGLGVYTNVFAFQMFRGLAYLATKGIMHRDIKTENMLICEATGMLKITDFGCAALEAPNLKYSNHVGTREFMSPELLLGSRHYTHTIDLWGAAVVLSEIGSGWPIFDIDPVTSAVQLIRIVEILGPPSATDCLSMSVKEFELTSGRTKAPPMEMMRRKLSSPFPDISLLIDLVAQLLVFAPNKRLSARLACGHALFKTIKRPGAQLPNGYIIAKTIDFTKGF